MDKLNLSSRVFFTFFLAVSVLFTISFTACPPYEKFLDIVQGHGNENPSGDSPYTVNIYKGIFSEPQEAFWKLTESSVEIRVVMDGTTVIGTGKQVQYHVPEYDGDGDETITYEMSFEGTYDSTNKAIKGIVKIKAVRTCSINCQGSDNYENEFTANWTATLSDDANKLWGHVDQVGKYGDFSATLVGTP